VGLPSPCVNVCRMHAASGWCEGCARTLEEIAAWGSLPDEAKLRVWRRLPERRDRLQALLAAEAWPEPDVPPAGPAR
jgi:predicted Fe-S protein YdhL (DUF1289 family)